MGTVCQTFICLSDVLKDVLEGPGIQEGLHTTLKYIVVFVGFFPLFLFGDWSAYWIAYSIAYWTT